MTSDQPIILRAGAFAQQAHGDSLDDNGENYYTSHILNVVDIIINVTNDKEIIAAAYLHDTIEDCNVTYDQLKQEFGTRVADLVMEVTQEGQKDDYGYYFPRLKTRDGILIKFADRLSNLSRMQSWDEKRKSQYLKRSKFWKDGSGK